MGILSRWFRKQRPARQPLPEAERRDYTRAELAEHDGTDPSRPLLLAVRGIVYDVGRGRDFYGPHGPYSIFAGKDCTRALAKMAFDPVLFRGDTENLQPEEIERLEAWIETFEAKYRKVGRLLDHV